MAFRHRTEPTSALRRVLYAISLDPSRKFGSLEEQILMLAVAFRQHGGLLLPLFSRRPGSERAIGFREAGVEVAFLDLERFSLRTLGRLLGLVSRHEIEIAHWGMLPTLYNPYVWALTLLRPRVRHFFTDHSSRLHPIPGPPPQPLRAIKRLLLRRFSRVVCVSDFVRQCLDRQQVWSNCSSCLHFINTDRFRPDPEEGRRLKASLGDGGRFVALVVGQLIPEKGIDVLLRALPLLPPLATVWVVGEGAHAPALRALAAELGVADRTRFLGSQANVSPFMQAADCLVCPSVWAEAAGLVNLEGQASGLPVVASRVGGIPEYVADGRTGLLFPPGDYVRLAALLCRLIEDGGLLHEFGRAARAHAVEHFSADARLKEHLALYERRSDPLSAPARDAAQELTAGDPYQPAFPTRYAP
jgi:glycosyltransferase involved in cell wall biosynthesis